MKRQIKNEAAICITQVAAFSFLTNFLINYSKCYYLYMIPRAGCPGCSLFTSNG